MATLKSETSESINTQQVPEVTEESLKERGFKTLAPKKVDKVDPTTKTLSIFTSQSARDLTRKNLNELANLNNAINQSLI